MKGQIELQLLLLRMSNLHNYFKLTLPPMNKLKLLKTLIKTKLTKKSR